jgi:hypothetical protein
MKTAMQELAQIMGVYYTKALMQPEDKTSFAIKAVLYEIMKKMDDELLKKEKEQIMDAFKYGWNWNFNAEKYYNETYNTAQYQDKANEFKDNDRIKINPITGDVKIITNEEN